MPVPQANALVIVSHSAKQQFTIEHSDVAELFLFLDDEMCNLDEPVTVLYQGKELFSGKVARERAVLEQTLEIRGDPLMMFDAKLVLKLK